MHGMWAQSALQGENEEVRSAPAALMVLGYGGGLTSYGLQDGAV